MLVQTQYGQFSVIAIEFACSTYIKSVIEEFWKKAGKNLNFWWMHLLPFQTPNDKWCH